MGEFAALTEQVHQIDDFILADMKNENEENIQKSLSFNQHLYATKYWFLTVSWANKKRFLLTLLHDLKNAWTLAYILRSIWNCRPKDSIMSACEKGNFSSYDAVPFDNNRTARPIEALVQVMRGERQWFLTLNPTCQYLVFAELLFLSGGPIMWEVLRICQRMYEKHRSLLLMELQDSVVVAETSTDKLKNLPAKKNSTTANQAVKTEIPTPSPHIGQAAKDLEMHLLTWRNTIKQMKDSLKLEEIEMSFTDGTKHKVWKVNRPKPEALETVDFIQLLPSTIAMRILSYLPKANFGDYAKVNAYWAYLIEEYKAQLNARIKIDLDLEKLKDIIMRHETSLDVFAYMDGASSSLGIASVAPSVRRLMHNIVQPSQKQSLKSGNAVSFKHLLIKRPKRPIVYKPIGKVSDLTDWLNQRGSVDEKVWRWCKSILKEKDPNLFSQENNNTHPGLITLCTNHFPCPMMNKTLNVPLNSPLVRDPIKSHPSKPRKKKCPLGQTNDPTSGRTKQRERYNLWTRNFSGLYPVLKISSYECPL